MSRKFDIEDVAQHNKSTDLYLIIDNKIYDCTQFQHEHPWAALSCGISVICSDIRRGGDEFLLDQGGTDVTELFEDAGHSEEARQILKTLEIGTVKNEVYTVSKILSFSFLSIPLWNHSWLDW